MYHRGHQYGTIEYMLSILNEIWNGKLMDIIEQFQTNKEGRMIQEQTPEHENRLFNLAISATRWHNGGARALMSTTQAADDTP